jgi:hypothetical protein
MKTIAALVIILSHQGYWFGGQDQTVDVRWAIDAKMPAAELHWDLLFGDVRIASGQTNLPNDGTSAIIHIKTPIARARAQMRWACYLTAPGGTAELASGEGTVELFPPVPLGDVAARLAERQLIVIDGPDRLPAILSAAEIDFVPLQDVSDLQSRRADLVVVGPDRLSRSLFSQSAIFSQAEAGAQVLLLEQQQPGALGGYVLGRRPMTQRLAWREEHPLFDHLQLEDLQSWLSDEGADLRPIQLPADEPALELAYWPREVAGTIPAPIDAMIAVKAVGKGRVIFCQLPLGDWASDPRARMFLYNALNYMCLRPEPTLPPSQRQATRPSATIAVPTIKLSPEDQP